MRERTPFDKIQFIYKTFSEVIALSTWNQITSLNPIQLCEKRREPLHPSAANGNEPGSQVGRKAVVYFVIWILSNNNEIDFR